MQPVRDLVLIQADSAKTQTESGILLQEEWKTLPLIGEILEVGPQVTQVKKGDRVTFNRYSSIILEKDQRLCKESQISGIL
jgi:co-chaperonin GroES (HSP10)